MTMSWLSSYTIIQSSTVRPNPNRKIRGVAHARDLLLRLMF